MRLRILDRYILKAFIGPFLFGIFAFTTIFVGTGTLFRIAQYITQYGASLWSVSKVFVLALPSIVTLTFPMAVLLASLLTIGRLSGSSEIIVMRAGGVSFLRLAAPVYIVAFFISIGAIAFNEYVVPQTNHMYQVIVREEIMKQSTPQTQSHIVLKNMTGDTINSLMYARTFDSKTKQLQTITVQQFNNGNLSQVENADTATWDGKYWIMHNGIIYDLSSGDGVERSMHFKEQTLPISNQPDEISAQKKELEEMTIRELQIQKKAYAASYVDTKPIEMEMYQRFTIPVASFVFAFVGAPLGLQKQRASSSLGFGLSIIIIFIYYGIMTFTDALGKGGAMQPLLAAWIPNTLGVIAGLYLNWRVSK